ncbi:flagellar protein FlgN [Nocardioides sp. GY 10113]|uniref:flagellar protein FlgN n=1 Tax=Nocardioides sp. GY 10113 TaxID=2569761 RepID=UPI0010A91FAC|nr:flagellar protein FlgN [Nocardioides sp. GY 10113]TIC85970.1 flagellar protein FlgN [Nocardioides sp. GY 10113]
MDELSQILWRERELLEHLAYKLEVERLLLSTGRTQWLPKATREIEDLLATIRETEVLRAAVADDVAARLGLGPNPSLVALAEAADEPWPAILADHRDALVSIAREIAEVSEDAKGLLTAGYRSARETLLAIGGGATESYTHDGAAVTDARRSHLLDRSL